MAIETRSVVLGNNAAVGLADAGTVTPVTGVDSAAVQAYIDGLDLSAAQFSGNSVNYDNLGLTAVDQNIQLTPEVTEGQTFDALQQSGVRTSDDSVNWTLVVPALQVFDNRVLTLQFGGGDTTNAAEFRIPKTRTPQARSVFLVIADPIKRTAVHLPRATVSVRESTDFGRDALSIVQLTMRISDESTSAYLGAIYNDLLGTVV